MPKSETAKPLAAVAGTCLLLSLGCGVPTGAGSAPPGTVRAKPRPGAVVKSRARTKREAPVDPVDLTLESFGEATSRGVWLVDFWAEWSPPCTMQAPIVNRIARRFAGRASVGKVDVVRQQGVSADLAVRAIPTLVVFKNGAEVWRLEGLQKESALAAALEAVLKKKSE